MMCKPAAPVVPIAPASGATGSLAATSLKRPVDSEELPRIPFMKYLAIKVRSIVQVRRRRATC
jgi:hypothetical protein